MRDLLFIAVCASFGAGTAVAGSPDNPGRNGEFVSNQIGVAQDAFGAKNGWGQAVRTESQGGGFGLGKLGNFLQEDREVLSGSKPNPENDNGSGND